VEAGELSHSGTTALAALVLGTKLILGHVGDCRAILCRNGRPVDLTTDHRPESQAERNRISTAGGYIDQEGYVNGWLQISRAIGDFHFTELKNEDGGGILAAEPEVIVHEVTSEDEFCVLATDGAFETMNSRDIVQIARNSLVEKNSPEMAAAAVVRATKFW